MGCKYFYTICPLIVMHTRKYSLTSLIKSVFKIGLSHICKLFYRQHPSTSIEEIRLIYVPGNTVGSEKIRKKVRMSLSAQKQNSPLLLSIVEPHWTSSSSPKLPSFASAAQWDPLSHSLSFQTSLCRCDSLAPSLGAEVNHALRPCSHCVPSATSVWGLCAPLISRGAMLGPECVSASVRECVCVCVPCPHYVATLGGQHGKFLLHYTPPFIPPPPFPSRLVSITYIHPLRSRYSETWTLCEQHCTCFPQGFIVMQRNFFHC